MTKAKFQKNLFRTALMSCATAPLMLSAGLAYGQDTGQAASDEIVVTGSVITRNRTTAISPELTYDREFFEKYEPVSVGDALKRTPGVAFTSDIGEYDAPQLRGLGEGFTQILINGRTIPGAGNNRSVLVDRIPAELVERLEIIRSPGADIDSQGVGGTINIVLKKGASLPPGFFARASGYYYNDSDVVRGAGALGYIGRSEDEKLTYSIIGNLQQRFNSKQAVQEEFDGGSFASTDAALAGLSTTSSGSVVGDGETREIQSDVRDNTDLSFNGDISYEFDDESRLSVRGFIINTDREEREDGLEYEDSPTNLDKIVAQDTVFDQTNFGIDAIYETVFGERLEAEFGAQYSKFDSKEVSIDSEVDGGDATGTITEAQFQETLSVAGFGLELDEQEIVNSNDKEFQGDVKFKLPLSGVDLKFGGQVKFRSRDVVSQEAGFDDGVLEDFEPSAGGGVFGITENRYDAFVAAEWALSDRLKLETGLRLEHSTTDQEGDTFAPISLSDTNLNPSVHLQYDVSDTVTMRASIARTLRRPGFDQRLPFEDEEEPSDDDVTQGNPLLAIEKSWGLDAGFEVALPGRGIMGFNGFYRDVDGLIQLTQVTNDADGDPTTPGGVFSFENVGSAEIYGFEFDLSTPLGFLGLPDTGIFANYTRLYSNRFDENFQRSVSINNQPSYVYNIGASHSFEEIGVSFGGSYQKQGDYTSHFFGEIETGAYGGNLEVFVEKRFGDRAVIRLSGNNLLDAAATQVEDKFDGDTGQEILDNSRAGNTDSFEVEREEATPIISFTLRLTL